MANNEYAYIQAMRDNFAQATKGVKSLFVADVDKDRLWQAYLLGFPESERQHYNCNACKSFIRHYGPAVIIDATGQISSPFWSAQVDAEHDLAFYNLNAMVRRASVSGILLSDETSWGTAKNMDGRTGHVWEHLSVTPPNSLVYRSRTKTPDQAMAEKKEEHKALRRALADFSLSTVEQALNLATSGALRRGDLVKAALGWFLEVKQDQERNRATIDNRLWLTVASAPAGFCYIRSSLAGSLMSDIQEGYNAADVKRRYEDKADPSQYQRAQVAPKAGNIAQAEKVIADLGLETALERRYAMASELPLFWRSHKLAAEQKVSQGPVFGHLKPKVKEATSTGLEIPAVKMTWDKFKRTVLVDALSMEVLVPRTTERFAGLVTAADPDAAPILQWDGLEKRNPVSWYYADGADASIRKRVKDAGGQVENVDVRISLAWNTYTDLDLHCSGPKGYIYFGTKRDSAGGYLDVDMNVSADTLEPVENIRWQKGCAPNGNYEVAVNNYTNRASSNPYKVELEIFGRVFTVSGNSDARSNPTVRKGDVATFQIYNGKLVEGSVKSRHSIVEGGANVGSWGLTSGQWVPVNGLCLSPNLWNVEDPERVRSGKHVFWLLDGCQDNNEGVGRGFFSEFLIGDLKPIRATLEAYSANAKLWPAPNGASPACGLGMSDAGDWNLTVRVQTKTGTRTVLIDRWD